MAMLKEVYASDTHNLIDDVQAPWDAKAEKEGRRLAATVLRYVTKARADGMPLRSLDVGSGAGWFSHGLAGAGFEPVMIDLDPRAEIASAQVPGARFYRTSFEELADRGPFTVIVMSQVLEHALDPMDWLGRSARLLQPGGALVVALPNFGGVYKILGARDPFLIPPVHLNFFTPKSLRLAFEKVGLVARRLDSSSEVINSPGLKPLSLKRRVAGGVWNAVSWVLTPTRFGIILRGIAVKRPNAPSSSNSQ